MIDILYLNKIVVLNVQQRLLKIIFTNIYIMYNKYYNKLYEL